MWGLTQLTFNSYRPEQRKRFIVLFVQKAVLLDSFSGELIIGGNLALQNGFGLSIKQLKTLRQRPKTAENS